MKEIILIIVIFCLIVAVILIIINFRDLSRYVIRDYYFKSDKILKDTKAIVLADLHNKSYGKNNEVLIADIDAVKPDFILVAGDMINATPDVDNENAYRLIEDLAKKYTIYYGMGNHEYRAGLYEQYGTLFEDMKKRYDACNVDMLDNKRVFLEAYNIEIVGLQIDRRYYKRFKVTEMENDYIESIVGAHNTDAFEIMLAHNPDYFDNYVKYGSDIILSGHVHGALIRLPLIGGVAHPAVRFFPKYSMGEYRKNNSSMVVSAGLGTHTIPLRLFDPGELSVIHISRVEEDT